MSCRLLTLLSSLFLSFFLNSAAGSQNPAQKKDWICSFGYDALIYQSRYAFEYSTGVEFLAGRKINQQFKAETGVRLGLQQCRPEGFIRIGMIQEFELWKPSISVELGLTRRAYFDSETMLLKETREAMIRYPGNSYLSTHLELLKFGIRQKYYLSFFEIDFGTHFKDFGKTLRLRTDFFNIGISF